MAPTLYMIPPSPPVRAVQITAKAIGLDLTEKELDLKAGEHLKPEYLKINPQHTVPTLVEDDGFAIWDSHAIMTYLVCKYAKNDSLYPNDLRKRVIVDQRLHFESGVVFPRVLRIAGPIVRNGKKTIDLEDEESANEVYRFMDAFLEGKQWIAGDVVTIADYSLISSISTLDVLVPIEGQKYHKVAAWMKSVKKLPEYEANKKGLEMFSEMIKIATMAPILYMFTPSPSVRAVLITAKAIGLELIQKEVNLAVGDHLKPEFLKINPQHTIPTLVDNDGFVVWDSHAIITYLVSKYAKDEALYPKDLKTRTVIDQRLYFEVEIVFPRVFDIADPIIRGVKKSIDQKDKDSANEVYGFLDAFMENKQWIAGDFISVADYSLVSSISNLNVLVPINAQHYPRVMTWLKKFEGLPEYEANRKGLNMFIEVIKSKLSL